MLINCNNLPTVRHLGRVALPELEEERRPEGHEDGEDDRRVVVEEVHDLRVRARLLQGPGARDT